MDIDAVLASLDLDQKVGQLFFPAFLGTDLQHARIMVDEYFVGGFYLSQDNLKTPKQTLELTRELQQRSLRASGLPLFLGCDQEGTWAVLPAYTTTGPGNMALGATGSPVMVEEMYSIFGRELRSLGLNVDLAPCADVLTEPRNQVIGARSFGDNPQRVAEFVSAAIRGLHKGGVLAAIKHFPGHGGTKIDSHRELALLDLDESTIREVHLKPFIHGIKAGADIVMTAHVITPVYDEQYPASLSSRIQIDLLRRELGFGGIILTDSFSMESIKKNYPATEAAVRAILSGADVIMLAEERYDVEVSDYLETQKKMIRAVRAAVTSGQIPVKRIDASVRRILERKALLSGGNAEDPPLGILRTPRHRMIEQMAAAAAVVVIDNHRGVLPFRLSRAQPIGVISALPREERQRLYTRRGIGPNLNKNPHEALLDAIARRHTNVSILDLNNNETQLDGYAVILAVTEKLPVPGFDTNEKVQIERVNRLTRQTNADVVVVGMRDPQDYPHLNGISAYVCSFGFREASAEAVAAVLFGEASPIGSLPIRVMPT